MEPIQIEVYRNDAGELRIRVDSPGERAVSASISDAAALIMEIADEAGLTVTIDGPADPAQG